jgi:hypothetical protein
MEMVERFSSLRFIVCSLKRASILLTVLNRAEQQLIFGCIRKAMPGKIQHAENY